jgi:hypothetical protein
MALKDVAPVLAKEFVELKLDYDRGIGARDIQKRFTDQNQGLPWFAFIDGDGKAIITSTGPKGNVGFPYQPDEIAYFKVMLEKLKTIKRHLNDADVAFLIKSLEDEKKRIEAGGGG